MPKNSFYSIILYTITNVIYLPISRVTFQTKDSKPTKRAVTFFITMLITLSISLRYLVTCICKHWCHRRNIKMAEHWVI